MSESSRYEPFASELVRAHGAEAAIVFVVGGVLGGGFARVERDLGSPDEQEQLRALMAQTLRIIADDIEKGITQPDQLKYRRGSA